MKKVISASRRTDIPAFYLDRLIGFLRQGFADVPNPYSGRSARIDLKPENVHTIVLWSKNFSRFLRKRECFSDYNLYFLFTINDMPSLEPSVPPLDDRLGQLRDMAHIYGPDRIAWRYDPVVFDINGAVSTVESYRKIGLEAAQAGVRRSIFSFMDMYGKVTMRNERFGLNLIDPPDSVKERYASELAGTAVSLGLSLETCSEESVSVEGIKPSACIEGKLLSKLAGEPASLAKDTGQRPACNCTVSRDIGSYRDMPCPQGCLYCYANPMVPEPVREES